MSNPFDLVIFDLGGVLVRHVRSWAEGHERAGLPADPPDHPDFEAGRRVLSARHQRGDLPSERYFEEVAALSDGVYTASAVRAIHAAWLIEEYSGVGAVLDALDATRVGTAVLSNTNVAHWQRELDPATARFPSILRAQHRYASHELGCAKPEPAVYAAVERGVGREPERILFFDDLPEYVEGARVAGWTAELVDHAGDTAAQLLAALRRHGVIE